MGEKRTIHYSFKASPEEDALIQKKMKAAGFGNRSAFIRAMTLNGYVLKLDLPEMKDVIRLMGNISGNVNQIAMRLHERGSIYETEADEIRYEQNEVRTLFNQILRRLDQLGNKR